MKTFSGLIAMGGLLIAGLAPVDAGSAAPGKTPPANDAQLSMITARIKEVLAAPSSAQKPAPRIDLQGWYYDLKEQWGIHSERQLQDQAYDLLALNESEESRLNAISDLIRQLPASDALAGAHLSALCDQLLERVEFMDGLIRVEIGRGLSASDRSSYSFQAVQSGIDMLDQAITLRTSGEKRLLKSGGGQYPEVDSPGLAMPGPAMPTAEMREIRTVIFGAWDEARAAGSPAPLAALSLGRVIGSAEATAARDPANKAWSAQNCFAWLQPSSSKPAAGP